MQHWHDYIMAYWNPAVETLNQVNADRCVIELCIGSKAMFNSLSLHRCLQTYLETGEPAAYDETASGSDSEFSNAVEKLGDLAFTG